MGNAWFLSGSNIYIVSGFSFLLLPNPELLLLLLTDVVDTFDCKDIVDVVDGFRRGSITGDGNGDIDGDAGDIDGEVLFFLHGLDARAVFFGDSDRDREVGEFGEFGNFRT